MRESPTTHLPDHSGVRSSTSIGRLPSNLKHSSPPSPSGGTKTLHIDGRAFYFQYESRVWASGRAGPSRDSSKGLFHVLGFEGPRALAEFTVPVNSLICSRIHSVNMNFRSAVTWSVLCSRACLGYSAVQLVCVQVCLHRLRSLILYFPSIYRKH